MHQSKAFRFSRRLVPGIMAGAMAVGCVSIVFSGTPDVVLEDAVLFTNAADGSPVATITLGDVDLGDLEHSLSDSVASAATHWWLLGHIGNDVVFSSPDNLAGVNLHATPPYADASPRSWDIPENLDAYVNGFPCSPEWLAQTSAQHEEHVAADGARAHLWRFRPTGVEMGQVTIDLHD